MNCDSERDDGRSLNVFESTVSLWLEGRNEYFWSDFLQLGNGVLISSLNHVTCLVKSVKEAQQFRAKV